ncbi:MAG: gluconate 2-dehydrogenase subunit 3 family protein [Acidobacteria bacterium]|nr:gluconate 2-dehydrogenase subunit 3 family protein [Acidobacteriota bacterium]
MTSRRDLLGAAAAMWAAAVAEAHEHASSAQAASYSFRFLTRKEIPILQRLAAILVPADERSGGAAAARVEEYVDTVLHHAKEPLRKTWRAGLKRFAKADEAALRRHAVNEFRARTADERFFVLLKDAVVEGFYTSREGIEKELGYRGYTFLREFPLADMGDVRRAVDYTPLLRERS